MGLPKPIDDVCAEPESEQVEISKESKAKPKTKNTNPKCPKKTSSKNKENQQVQATASKYVAGDFNEIFAKYVKEQKAQGVGHRDALKSWKESDVRSELLKGMPLSEQKKRKFID